MRKPKNMIACLVIVAMATSTTLQAEDKVEPVLRTVAATESVSVMYVAGKGFKITGQNEKGAVQVLNGRIGILPTFVDGKFNAVGIVTWEPAKGEKMATWPNLQAVKGIKAQRIDATLNIVFKPVLVKSMLSGFSLVAITSKKAADSDGEVMPAGKKDKSVAHKMISLNLPKERNAELWYGVMLVPAFDKDGKVLKGFDVTLVATPRKAN